MSATTTLNLIFPQEAEREWAYHLSTLDIEPKIFAILNVYLQPSSQVSAVIAVQEITQFYSTDPALQQPGTHNNEAHIFLLQLWVLFIKIIEQIPWHHPSQDKLVELMKAIHNLPNPTTISFEVGQSHHLKLWTDLPMLSWVLVDNVETHCT